MGKPVRITGCGRTDTGVHARSFFAHFDLDRKVDDVNELCRRLNHMLPPEILLFRIFPVSNEVHARFSALSRTYHYYLFREKDPFNRNWGWLYRGELNHEAMNRAAAILKDVSDFTSFAKLHTETKTNICKVSEAKWITEGNRWVFIISADRFLRNMVRAVVGTLVDIGRGKISEQDFIRIIEARDRSAAGPSAPARGLFLEKVCYPAESVPGPYGSMLI